MQIICYDTSQVHAFSLVYLVPQESVLGSVENIIYTEDMADIPCWHRIRHPMFAEDTQLYAKASVTEFHLVIKAIHK